MAEAEVLQLYELRFSDLKLLSSGTASSSIEEIGRLETIRISVMKTLGPGGPGLLSITDVPHASILRRKLLPLARKLALLNPDDRKRVLKVTPFPSARRKLIIYKSGCFIYHKRDSICLLGCILVCK